MIRLPKSAHAEARLIGLALLTVGVNAGGALLLGRFAAWNWSLAALLGSVGVGVMAVTAFSNGTRQKLIDALLYLFLAVPASMAAIYAVGCGTFGECL